MTLPRRPRAAAPADANLDDLLRFEEAPPTAARPSRPDSWLPRAGLDAFAISAVAYTAFRVFELAVPYPLVLAVSIAAVLIRRAVKVSHESPLLKTATVVKARAGEQAITPGGWFTDPDGLMDAIRRWNRRLDWGATAPERFRSTVVDRLGQLADEVLRQRHGLTRASDPARARELLGPDVWGLLEGTEQLPTPERIAAIVHRLENL